MQLAHMANSSFSRPEEISLEMSLFQRLLEWKCEISSSHYSIVQREALMATTMVLGDENLCIENTVYLFLNPLP